MPELTQWNPSVSFATAPFQPGKDWRVNNAVLTGEKWTLVWDTFATPEPLSALSDVIGENSAFAVYSHADWDHCWGTCAVPFVNVIAHREALTRFQTELPSVYRLFYQKSPKRWGNIRLVPPDFTFSESLTLDLGGLQLELSAFGGHTADSIVGYLPQFGLLLAGDVVEEIPVINDPARVPEWISGLRKWLDVCDLETVLPGHGAPTDKSRMEKNLDYLSMLQCGKRPESQIDSAFYEETHQNNCKLFGV